MKYIVCVLFAFISFAYGDTPPPTQILQLKAGSCSGVVQGATGTLSCSTVPLASVAASSNHNTLGYFNNSGTLSSNANYRLNDTNGWLVISTLGSGSTTSNVGATGGAGMVVGNVAGASSILSTSTGNGQLAVGQALSTGQVSAQGNGSAVVGYASNSGIVATELDGSIAVGRADTSGQVSANGKATQAFGYADGSSILGGVGNGSMAIGYATSSSNVVTTTGKYGQFAGGYAATSANLVSSGNGAFSYGYCDSSNGSIAASGDGSLALGRAHGGVIGASGTGATALGYAASYNVTASGNGSFAGGDALTAANVASGTSAFAFGDGNTGSGNLSTTFGLGNSNGVYGTIVGGKYASISGTSSSWVSTDPLFVLGNGTSGSNANAVSILKNGNTTINGTVTGTSFTGQMYGSSGSVSAPGFAFSSENSTGIYRVGSGEMGVAILGAQALDFQKSTSGYGNVGMGGGASTSDSYPLLMQRDVASAGVYAQISNVDTAAYSKATWQLAADGGNNNGEISLFTSATTLDAYANAMTVRPSNSTAQLSLIGGDLSTGKVIVYTAGDYTSTGRTAVFNSDHSTTLKGLLQLPVQGSGTTPTCGSAQDGSLALTNGHKLCVCVGGSSAWKNASDGSTSCTF